MKGKKHLAGRETETSVAEEMPAGEKPKQAKLKGMEDTKLPDLHKAAESYIEVRDRRMELTRQEIDAKDKVLQLLKKHDKEKYVCDGVEIYIVHEKENVKVKIRDDEEEEDQN